MSTGLLLPDTVPVRGQQALGDATLAFVPMVPDHVPLIAAIDQTAYSHPWNERHFADSLGSGHLAQLLVARPAPDAVWPDAELPGGERLLGYVVAMKGVDEVHLLNITTVPNRQRQGWARLMLQALADWSRRQAAPWLWLEVRASNFPARTLYGQSGLSEVGLRRAYYPAANGLREDAVVMSWNLEAAA